MNHQQWRSGTLVSLPKTVQFILETHTKFMWCDKQLCKTYITASYQQYEYIRVLHRLKIFVCSHPTGIWEIFLAPNLHLQTSNLHTFSAQTCLALFQSQSCTCHCDWKPLNTYVMHFITSGNLFSGSFKANGRSWKT